MATEETQEIHLEADQELRVEVENKNETVTVEVSTGDITFIFGLFRLFNELSCTTNLNENLV